jgi:hypothetical protein
VVLIGCLTGTSCGVPFAHQSRYVGNLPGCTIGPSVQATLVQAANRFSFAPSDGALVVMGSVAPDGSFAGSLVTNPPGRDRQGRAGTEAFTLTVTGRIEGNAASGTYVTPRCSTAFRLPRIGDSLLP